ncbi:hypothetical protein DFP81_101246 [Marinomonas pollencensis]|uniref:Uncharacterized protein n=1 Tax=Marinomonas pollencensis TaxID=491954 RepID=A0A3E0DX62_9GAMM|nr:hypothetical protein DFP81_101246 [Marinomonas pollencensis]
MALVLVNGVSVSRVKGLILIQGEVFYYWLSNANHGLSTFFK